jgi:phage terminase small subunit
MATKRKRPVKIPKDVPYVEKRKPGRPRATTTTMLTRKQEIFVKELVSNDGMITLREAAIRAGYPEGSAHSRAYELTNPHISPHVVAEIKRFRNELDEKYGVTYQRHLRDLKKIRDQALENGAYSAAVQAEFRRGQAHGDIYVNKSEIRHGTIDSMSKDEVLKALDELKDNYNVIDVTPEDDDDLQEGGRTLSVDEEWAEDIESETQVH